MKGLQAASQETCLSWSPIERPGCAEREEIPSGDGEAARAPAYVVTPVVAQAMYALTRCGHWIVIIGEPS
jgi:hypothetical protein